MTNTWSLSPLRVDLESIARLFVIWFRMSAMTGPVARWVIVAATWSLALGFNATESGKRVWASCLVNDQGTVIALEIIFSPFTIMAPIFVGDCGGVFSVRSFLTPRFFQKTAGASLNLKRGI